MANSSASENVVIKITQQDFFEVLWNQDFLKHFDVEVIDDGDVLDVSVSLISKQHGKIDSKENKVGYKLLETLPEDDNEAYQLASEVSKELSDESLNPVALLVGKDSAIAFICGDSKPKRTTVILQPSKEALHSRHRGILESDLLQSKKVAVIGLGSGGSHVAIELAKAGVGHFVLIDYDRIELSNVARHICGLKDLGRFKTKAVRDQILDKNPFAKIVIHNIDINDIKKAKVGLKDCDLIIAATDNKRSRLNINDIAFEFNIPVIFGQCKARAAAGDVVVVRPGLSPCFSCICGNSSESEEISSTRQAREKFPAYDIVSDEDIEATVQVGLSSDILPISNMVVKIALVELSRGMTTGLTCLEEDFQSSFYVWCNRDDEATNYIKLEANGLECKDKPSILRWYADRNCSKNEECLTCNENEREDDSSGDEQ